MKNKASKRKKKESTPKRRSQGSKYPIPSAGKNSSRNRSNYPPSDAGDTAIVPSVGYEEEYYDVSNIDESMAYIGFKALAATKIVILLYSLISCFHLQVTGTGLFNKLYIIQRAFQGVTYRLGRDFSICDLSQPALLRESLTRQSKISPRIPDARDKLFYSMYF